MITPEQIRRLAPHAHLQYQKALGNADVILAKNRITTPLRMAHFIAQLAHECGGFTILRESLNYSPEGLLATFGTTRVSKETAALLGRTSTQRANQIAIANAIYGGAWGKKNLGNELPNDGWTYRGGGMTQLTGRANYRRIGEAIGVDLEATPDLVCDPRYALEVPCVFWSSGGCNELADADDIRAVTKAINGGLIGLEDRKAWLKKTKSVFNA